MYIPGSSQHLFFTLPYTLQPKHSMFVVCLIVSYFFRNGFTVDDLGLLLAMFGVIILITAVIFRAVVRLFVHRSQARCPLTPNLQRLLVWIIIPAEYRNELLRRVSFMFLSTPITNLTFTHTGWKRGVAAARPDVAILSQVTLPVRCITRGI